jgi:putative cell wall-binding protein
LDFGVPDSIRPLDPTQEIDGDMGFSSLSTDTGQPIVPKVTNQMVNFGWEYVWHCHILSHEEMDMMRPMSLAVARSVPDTPALAGNGDPGTPINLTWTDGTPAGAPGTLGNPANEVGFRIERATVTSEGVESTYTVIANVLANQTTYTDNTTVPGRAYRYIVYAYNAATSGIASDPVTLNPPGGFFDRYVITPRAGVGGTISPPSYQDVLLGEDSPVFTITPEPGYSLVDVMIDGISVGTGTTHQFFNVDSDHTVWAFFLKDNFTVSPSAGPRGNISPNWQQVVDRGDDSATFTFTPNLGYHVADVRIDGVSIGVVDSYAFKDMQANHSIEVLFEINVYTIAATAGAGGTITPAGSQMVTYASDSPVFNITPSPGYYIHTVKVDGVSKGAITSQQFKKVRENHSIEVTFSLKRVSRFGSGILTNALKTAGYAYPGWAGVEHVVIASGDSAMDARFEAATAPGLAGAYDAPLLLVGKKTLRADIRRALIAMPDGIKVHIVGGTRGVSTPVLRAIRAVPGVASVDRVYGADRYGTAVAVARRMKLVMGTDFPATALVVSAERMGTLTDAVPATVISAKQGFPIFYVKKNTVPVRTSAALFDLGMTKRYVIGHRGAVSDKVRSAVGVPAANRISGRDGYATSLVLAKRARTEGWLTGTMFGVASNAASANWSGAYLAKRNGPLLYVRRASIPAATSTYLSSQKATIIGGYVFGPTSLVSASVRTQLLTRIR